MFGRSSAVSNAAIAQNLGHAANELHFFIDELRRAHETMLGIVNDILTGHQLNDEESHEVDEHATAIVRLIEDGRRLDFEGAAFELKADLARASARRELE